MPLKDLRIFIDEKPFSYRFEMVDYLAEEYDVNISEDTISRVLAREKISRKKVSPISSDYACKLANNSSKK